MAAIHVARDGAKLGEFSLEQIREGLATGQFRPADLGWQTGMADWRPLGDFAVEKPATPESSELSATTGPASGAESGLPWEHRQQIGFFKAFIDTVSVLITKPTEAFTLMKREGGLTDPLLFGLIGGTAGTLASILFQVGLQAVIGGRNPLLEAFGIGGLAAFIIFSPLLVACGLFVGSGLLHVFLMMLGGANRTFETTFRVVGFATGATQLFSIIPICGGYVTAIYTIVLECIGLREAHQTTTGKALLAVLLPIIICCGVMALVFGLVVAGSGAEFMKAFGR